MVFMWVLDPLYSLLGNWLKDHTSWASSGIGVKIISFPKNFWSLVLNFTTPRYAFLFSNSETYIVHVIIFEWSRSVNFSPAYVLYAIQTYIFQQLDINKSPEPNSKYHLWTIFSAIIRGKFFCHSKYLCILLMVRRCSVLV